jgi:hypothetical protein
VVVWPRSGQCRGGRRGRENGPAPSRCDPHREGAGP